MIIHKAHNFLLCIAEENAYDYNGKELSSIEHNALYHNPNYVSNYPITDEDKIRAFPYSYCIHSELNCQTCKICVFC